MPETSQKPRSLQEEIQQSKPFHSKGHEAYLSLLRTADDAKRQVSTVLEEAGITLQQYNVLRILRGADKRGLPTLAVADRMLERTPGVTRLVDRMEVHGWVTRERCTEDRRRVWCKITDQGLDLLASLDEPISANDDYAFECLDDQEVTVLIDYLGRVRAHRQPLFRVRQADG